METLIATKYWWLQQKVTSTAINLSQQPWWYQTVCNMVFHDGKHYVCQILRNISQDGKELICEKHKAKIRF